MSNPSLHAAAHAPETEEHELPCLEAVLAGTLALMTGYSQALQAELQPHHRISMGAKIGANLAMLGDHPALSPGFRHVLVGLRSRWRTMRECTVEAARECDPSAAATTPICFQMQAPEQLQ